jgi:site-specific recombinase XerD
MSRTTAIPSSIQTINGYPKKLVIYLTPASQFYWTRVYYQGKYHTQSTKTNDVKKAKQVAIKFYEQTLVNAVLTDDPSETNKSFAVVGRAYLDSVENTQLKQTYRNDLSRFNHALVPFFGEQDIQTITNAQISRFLATLKKDGSSSATQTHYLVVLRKILKFAIANDLIDKLPVFPKVHGKLQTSQKRDYLTDEEYDSLIKMSEVCASEQTVVRGVTITLEMKLLIQFMVNSFIRPSDLRVLKHKHVNIKKDKKDEWIVLSHPATKTTANEVQAMPATVGIYRQLCELRLKTQKKISPDEFVFFPQYKIRDTAMSVIGRLFREILDRTDIAEQTDKNVTLYSLRHTAIMMRLVKGNVNTLHLARNARTSQQMIDQFYASHLTTDQVREHLHRFESVEKKKTEKKIAQKTTRLKKTSSKSVQ